MSTIEPDQIFETTYRTIIEGYEWDHLREGDRYKANTVIKANPDNFEEMLERLRSKGAAGDFNQIYNDKVTSLVPPLIKKIYPRLKDEMYNTLRHDIAFLKQTALFCEECTLHIQQSQEDNLKAQKSSTEFYGTGRLKPETIKFRYLVILFRRSWSNFE